MRKRRAEKRHIKPDPKHNDLLVAKFVNYMMWDGKKSTSRKMVYESFDIIEKKTKKPAIEVFKKAVDNVQPLIEVRSRRVGGATYQVPMEVPAHRQFALATRWIIAAARARSGKSFAEKLAGEFMDAANNAGSAVRRREETHRMAEANRAFSHYRL